MGDEVDIEKTIEGCLDFRSVSQKCLDLKKWNIENCAYGHIIWELKAKVNTILGKVQAYIEMEVSYRDIR